MQVKSSMFDPEFEKQRFHRQSSDVGRKATRNFVISSKIISKARETYKADLYLVYSVQIRAPFLRECWI